MLLFAALLIAESKQRWDTAATVCNKQLENVVQGVQ